MTLEKKWIFISLLSTFLWAENNKTNSSNETGIFSSISNFFTQGNTESNASEDENNLSNSSTIHNDNVSIAEDNETNSSSDTGIFTTISNFFTQEVTENNTSNIDANSSAISNDNLPIPDTNKSINKGINNTSSKIITDMNHFDGAWHLRVLDGMEVRKARAILDFTFTDEKTKLSGFDGCNRIGGNIQKSEEDTLIVPSLISTRMACRTKIHRWVSTRLHQVLGESFTLKEENKYDIDGITIKSSKHELFFKKMERN